VTIQKDLLSFWFPAKYTHFKPKTASKKLKLEEEISGRKKDGQTDKTRIIVSFPFGKMH
jgi:hypothetical protein